MSVEYDSAPLSPWRRGLILATVTIATALYAMTITIANVALPQIQGTFSATKDEVAWVVTFNIVATAIATPTTGWLVARLGQRRVMILSVLGFTAATLLCGLAGGLIELVAYRIAQGLFGAPLAPLSQAIVLDSYPKSRHGAVTSIFGMGVVLGPIVAPTLGGYLSETYNWRWVFFMVVPLGVACLIGVMAYIRDRHENTRVSLDWTGFLALSVAIACLQLVLDRGERNDWFNSTEILIQAGVAAIAIYVFVVHSLTADRPFLNPRLLLDRNFALGLLITIVFGMLNITPMVLLPTMLQDIQGYPDSIVGLLLGARALGTLVGFSVMLFASHFDPRIWLFVGFTLQGAAGLRMAQFNAEVSTLDVAWASAIQGLGVGLLWVPITLVTFATLNRLFLAEGMAIFHLLRNIGSSMYVSISVTVLIHSTKVNYAGLAESISPYRETLRIPQFLGAWSTESVRGLASLSGEIMRQSAMVGYLNAFYMYGLTAFAVLPLILFVRRPKK